MQKAVRKAEREKHKAVQQAEDEMQKEVQQAEEEMQKDVQWAAAKMQRLNNARDVLNLVYPWELADWASYELWKHDSGT